MSYDHTDVYGPMNRFPWRVIEQDDKPILGAISYDEDGSVWAYVYRPLGGM